MIDCPICHVPNDDDARFCAECGQRLQQPTPQPGPPPAVPPGTFTGAFNAVQQPPQPAVAQPQAPQQPPDAGSPPAGGKLHSPLLGGGPAPGPGPAAPISSDKPEIDRLRRMTKDQDSSGLGSGPAPAQDDQEKSGPPRKLRSPLLAQEEFDEEPTDFGGQGTPHASAFPHRQSGGQLRSPLLGGEESGPETAPPQAPGGGGTRSGKMRSPLLGGGGSGGTDDYDDYQGGTAPPSRGPAGGGGKKLRSRMLSGGGDDYGGSNFEEEYDDDPYADEDNPNVLRSPLLAAKRSTGPHSHPGTLPTVPQAGSPQTLQPQAPHIAPQPVAPPTPPPAPPVPPQPPQPTAQQPSPQAPPQPSQPVAPPNPAQQSASSAGGWAGPGQPGGPPPPGPRPGANEQLQTDSGSDAPPAPGKFQGTGTWYSEKSGSAGSEPQSLSGQQPNYPNVSPPAAGGPLWSPPESPLPSQATTPSGGPGASPSPNPSFGAPIAPGGPTPGSFPEEDYSKLRRQPGEPTPASLGAVPPAKTGPSGLGPLPHPAATPISDLDTDTARGGAAKGDTAKPIKRTGSRLLSNISEEVDTEEPLPASNRFNRGAQPGPVSAPSSGGPILKVLGGICVIVLLMKLYSISLWMGTDWWRFMAFQIDHFAMVILLIALIIYSFVPRN